MSDTIGLGNACGPAGYDSSANENAADLKSLVADRVRRARERKDISRRALSEISGVSQRYLAQIESGEGNISICLLQKVAVALDHRVEWLVGEEDPWDSEVLRAAELFRTADRTARDAALRALDPEASRDMRAGRICLIGLRGAGKSTLGAMAANALQVPFLELDEEIEAMGGMPVAEIFALYGQEGYRQFEAEALERVVSGSDRMILAAAGGIVTEPGTFGRLLTRCSAIWLKASPQEHMERVRAQGDERPMAGNPEAMAQLKRLLRTRETLYARAQALIDTSGETPEASLRKLLEIIDTGRLLDREGDPSPSP